VPWRHIVSALLICKISTRQRWVASFMRWTIYPLNRRLGGPHSQSVCYREEKNWCTCRIPTLDFPAHSLFVTPTMNPWCHFNILFKLKASQTLLCYLSLSETHWQTAPTFCCYIRSPISIILRLEQTELKVTHQPLFNKFFFSNRLYKRPVKRFIFCSMWVRRDYKQTFSDHMLASHCLPARDLFVVVNFSLLLKFYFAVSLQLYGQESLHVQVNSFCNLTVH
jgi:hypothetical protein